MKKFDYSLDYKNLNLRERPELYAIGKGEQGVLLVEPYKSEILPYWRFKNPEIASKSATKIYELFLDYLRDNDFVGADMARKYLQMGFTRARRYANYKGGKKYDGPVPKDKKGQSGSHGRKQLERQKEDVVKAEAAAIFKTKLELAKSNADYLKQKKNFVEAFG
ncbi:DUF4385 domain-containing protein [Costertonia aggregata]|uniref:DUF4385 domain-containing protein n=1 Tax=Costertonia aggregata TaxID=343403 RepID=A0A7H9ASW1_9FLAO|nr:DUF4385 domain-containing protein [Costertonia aggregata]QLG46497.1 DUF4385 domain-containing protein [Costertonia aggregata]